jgi:carboxypeptidase Taq
MMLLGFDFDSGRLDVSMHPFSTGVRGDHRITTRFREADFVDALMATAHETGHASYEAGLPERWEGLPVGWARNMCIHESQSLFFEKHLYLNRHFLDFFTTPLHECLPETARLDGERIWSESIRVRPSFIRIEADEVTYPLHVVLRFEVESGLIDGALEAEDIPDLWDRKMQQYLGLSTKGNDKDGCLQDIHWTDGAFGYFPSYTMGALNAAQIADAVGRALPDWRERLGKGDISPVRRWLHENVWRRGSLLDSQEILRSATGEKTNPRYFLDHLRARYLEHRY